MCQALSLQREASEVREQQYRQSQARQEELHRQELQALARQTQQTSALADLMNQVETSTYTLKSIKDQVKCWKFRMSC